MVPAAPFRPLSLALAFVLAFSGCSRAEKTPETPAAPAPAPAASEATAAPSAEAASSSASDTVEIASAPHPSGSPTPVVPAPTLPSNGETVRVLVPAGHGPAWLAEAVQKETGTKVVFVTYTTPAEFQTALPAADIVSIDDRQAADLVSKQILRPLPVDTAPPAARPSHEFLYHYYDPKGLYVFSYGWTLLGFAYSGTPNPAPRTWRELGRDGLAVSFPASYDDAAKQALWNLANNKLPSDAEPLPANWKAAEASALAAGQPNHVWIDSLSALRPLKSRPGETWQVVLPSEGALLRIHHWALTVAAQTSPNAAKPQVAEAVLRSLANPAASARLAVELDLAVTQPEAKKLLPPATAADPLLYPAQPLLNGSRFVR